MFEEMTGRWALVTGAGGEIGRETAFQLAAVGVNIVATDIIGERAEETAHAVAAKGGKAEALTLDISDAGSVAATLPALSDRLGGIEYLANVAGIYAACPLEEVSPSLLDRIMSVNVNGLFHVCQAIVPGMLARGRGAIVNVSSVHGQKGFSRTTAYSASKGAVIAFTRSLAYEKAPSIRVNAVAPGPTDTAEFRGNDNAETLKRRIEARLRTIPLGRIGTVEEIARVILFLLSPGASFITGHVIAAGGGEVMS